MREHKGKSLIALPSAYVVIDTETTGLDPAWDQLIEVAAVRFENGEIIDSFSSLVKPGSIRKTAPDGTEYELFVDQFITELTGITNEMLAGAPEPDEVMPMLISFIGDSVLVAHNANFDINFIYDTVEWSCATHFKNDFVDTLRIARKVFPELQHHRLSDIAYVCGVEQPTAHRAEADSIITGKCFEIIRKLILEGQTEEDFIRGFRPTGSHYASILDNISEKTDEIDDTNPVFGKNVVFTGALSKMERKEAFQIVANLGGIPKDSITAKTNFLVIGNTDYAKNVKNGKTGKMKKAEDYQKKGFDIAVLSEDAFFDMISDYL